MKRISTLAALLLTLPVIAGGGRQAPPTGPFQLVSGNSYEGAVIPASLVPDWFKEKGVTSTWTPTTADVAGRAREALRVNRSRSAQRPEHTGTARGV